MSVTRNSGASARLAAGQRTPSFSAPWSLGVRGIATGWRRLGLGVAVRWQAVELDRDLASGVSFWASDAHALRALRITRRRHRANLAGGLARVLRTASESGARFTAAVPPDRRAVLAARPAIEALERRLRGREAVAARGMAMLGELLTDPTSPLYQPDEPGNLGSRLRAAAAAMEPGIRWE